MNCKRLRWKWKRRRQTERRVEVLLAAVIALQCAVLGDEIRGHADIAVQGFIQGASLQPVSALSGLAIQFRYYLPAAGLLEGSLESYAERGRLRIGEDYLRLRGLPWFGMHWDASAGDFRVDFRQPGIPQNNLFLPELRARGVAVAAESEATRIEWIAGRQVLSAGPRIPFFLSAPTNVFGASLRRRWNSSFTLASRILRIQWRAAPESESWVLPPGILGPTPSTVWRNELLWRPASGWTVYGEGSVSRTAGISSFSGWSGLEYSAARFTARANYARLTADYLPVAASFAGDRQGPYGEARYRVREWMEIYGSAQRYLNNLASRAALPTFRSRTETAGGWVRLPKGFYLSGQMVRLRLATSSPSEPATASYNRQAEGALSHVLGPHHLRYTLRCMSFESHQHRNRQRSFEIRDNVLFRGWSVGGAARFDESVGVERRRSLFLQGDVSVRAAKIVLYANLDAGRDMLNETLFATQAVTTSVAGISFPLGRHWQLQVEGLRNRLTSRITPERLFVLSSGGVPMNPLLADFNRWTFFFRLSRGFDWGGELPLSARGGRASLQDLYPVTGILEGTVTECTPGGPPAEGVTIALDTGQTATTDAAGYYRLDAVPSGRRTVTVDLRRLPADYELVGPAERTILVEARTRSKLSFTVQRLGRIEGFIQAPEGVSLESVILWLKPGSRYTTPSTDGDFSFHNVLPGEYEVSVDQSSLPGAVRLTSQSPLRVRVTPGEPAPLAVFRLELTPVERPVRRLQVVKRALPDAGGSADARSSSPR